MIEVKLIFTDDEAKRIFSDAGLTVEMHDMPFCRKVHHNKECEEMIPCWVVINPYTGEPVLLRKAAETFLKEKARDLFLEGNNKLDIYNLFDNEKNNR